MDHTIFNIEPLNPFDIYRSSIGDDIYSKDFLSFRWVLSKGLIDNMAHRIAMLTAVRTDSIGLIAFLHGIGEPFDAVLCTSAARYGKLDVLIYLHEYGCPWNTLTTSYAAENGHLECLRYAHENGCEWDETTCSVAASNGHPPASCRLIV